MCEQQHFSMDASPYVLESVPLIAKQFEPWDPTVGLVEVDQPVDLVKKNLMKKYNLQECMKERKSRK